MTNVADPQASIHSIEARVNESMEPSAFGEIARATKIQNEENLSLTGCGATLSEFFGNRIAESSFISPQAFMHVRLLLTRFSALKLGLHKSHGADRSDPRASSVMTWDLGLIHLGA